ncbi:MAG: GTP-binding protein [Methanoregula sp.]|nr:GTP-binding protein [Methanoregula sp.]
MEDKILKLVIVGHVDHGKSTLIGRLLFDTNSLPNDKISEIQQICSSLGKDFEYGFILDNLEEERDQGITIDTTQIFFSSGNRQYVIIDAPGHVEFVKNMITGASQAEAAVVIIDAEEGVKEQTRRHAYILGMLGIQKVIVLINKMDRVGYDKKRFNDVKESFVNFLNAIKLNAAYFIPICANTGDNIVKRSDNIPWYQGPTFLEALDSLQTHQSPNDKPLRFIVQDVYNFSRRIIGGKVLSGVLHQKEEILILPSKEKTRIQSLEEYMKNPTEAETGKCIGVTTADKVFCDRGYVFSDPFDSPMVTRQFCANIFWMDKEPCKKDQPVTFRCSTQESRGMITQFHTVINSSSLERIGTNMDEIHNREVALVTIQTDNPVVVEKYMKTAELGRFVLVTDDISAGGIITEVIQ